MEERLRRLTTAEGRSGLAGVEAQGGVVDGDGRPFSRAVVDRRIRRNRVAEVAGEGEIAGRRVVVSGERDPLLGIKRERVGATHAGGDDLPVGAAAVAVKGRVDRAQGREAGEGE